MSEAESYEINGKSCTKEDLVRFCKLHFDINEEEVEEFLKEGMLQVRVKEKDEAV